MINHNAIVVSIASAYLIALGIVLVDRFDQGKNKNLVPYSAEELSLLDWADLNGDRQKIQKEEGIWYYAGMEEVDSIAFNGYLNGLVSACGQNFSELSSARNMTLAENLTLYAVTMGAPTIISAYRVDDPHHPFIIKSTAHPDALFVSDSAGLYKRIFTDLRKFWPHGQ